MNDNTEFLLKAVNVAFLIIWGTWERVSAIKKNKKHSAAEDRDSSSLLIFYATILLGYFIGIPLAFSPWGTIPIFFPAAAVAGFLVIASGLAVRLTAIRTLNEQFTYSVKIVDNHQLITDGIYKHVRHPAYLGQSLIFLGSGIAFCNWFSLVLLFLPNFLAALYRIAVEEKVLKEHFADQYTEYSKRTKLLIPGIY